MTITNSNLYSESYNILKNFIKNNITDPRNRYLKDWIHASMPNVNARGFSGYPFIVLTIDISEENKSFDRTSDKTFRILFAVYSDEATEVDSISDEIYNNLIDETKLREFQVKDLGSSSFEWDLDQKGKKIVRRMIGVIAKKRI